MLRCSAEMQLLRFCLSQVSVQNTIHDNAKTFNMVKSWDGLQFPLTQHLSALRVAHPGDLQILTVVTLFTATLLSIQH